MRVFVNVQLAESPDARVIEPFAAQSPEMTVV